MEKSLRRIPMEGSHGRIPLVRARVGVRAVNPENEPAAGSR